MDNIVMVLAGAGIESGIRWALNATVDDVFIGDEENYIEFHEEINID